MKDGGTAWTGVRNFQARNNLKAMRKGDRVLYYHSVTGKEVVGVAAVTRRAYPDPTAKSGDWVCVDLKPVKPLACPGHDRANQKKPRNSRRSSCSSTPGSPSFR